MSKIEMIILSVITAFYWMTAFVLKPAPKQAYFGKRTWILALLATIAIVYWYMNGMKF